MSQTSLFTGTAMSGADFSPCKTCGFTAAGSRCADCETRTYRYRLWRIVDAGPTIAVIGLNPSTADVMEEDDPDPTIARLQKRFVKWRIRGVNHSAGKLMMLNLFAYRATDPREMQAAEDPIGPEADDVLIAEARAAAMVVCAWGTRGKHRGRAVQAVRMLREAGVTLHALRLTKEGAPEHPLYLPADLRPVEWSP